MSARRRGLWREPLVLMVALGVAIFAFDAWRRSGRADPQTIEVTDTVRQHVASELKARLGRAPSDEELAAGVERWIDREVLYREALALGLDRDDPVIRDRLVRKVEFIQQSVAPPVEVDDVTLQAYAAAHPERYGARMRYDFVQLAYAKAADPDGAQARAGLAELQAGADPKALGPTVGTSRKFTPANAARSFGPAFAEALAAQPVGEWALLDLPDTYTLLRVDAATAEGAPDMREIAERVRRDYVSEQQRAHLDAVVQRLREGYRIEGVP